MENQTCEKICGYPFWHAEIDCDGNVSCCCPDYTDFYFFGNIFKQKFEDIWFGEKWQNFRKKVMNCDYEHCNLNMCMGLDDYQFKSKNNKQLIPPPPGSPASPKYLTLSLDTLCNVKCIFCRDKQIPLAKEDSDRIIGMIDDYFIPMLENTEKVTLDGAGELFASKFCKIFISKATAKYPKLKFDILTNGLLCNEKTLKKFGLLDRIDTITVSTHATTEETYNKIVKGSDFKKVQKNLRYISSLKRSGKVREFALTFVVTSLNYQELPDFIEQAIMLDAYPNIWPIRPFNDCKVCHDIEKYDITKKSHPEHQKFLEILKDPNFRKYHTYANGQIDTLLEEDLPKYVCKYPFQYAEIHPSGEIACCCSSYTDDYFFGNIFKHSFDEIWNGNKAKYFRRDILKQKYSNCHLNMCSGIDTEQYINIDEVSENAPYPKIVNFSVDDTCNVKCRMCRDKIRTPSAGKRKKLAKMVDTTFIPMLKNAELLQLNGEGELFASSICLDFIKKAAETYPDLKFELITNGQLCSRYNLKKLNITDRIERITISLHASTKTTYERVVRGGKFERVMKNIEYLNSLHKRGKIGDFSLAYVISSVNYKDLKGFVKLVNKLKIVGQLRELMDWGDVSRMCRNFDQYNIVDKNHPKHEDFVKLLNDPIFDSEYCMMNDIIRSVQKEFNETQL